MATINITDNLALSTDLEIRNDSPLAKAGITKMVPTAKQLFEDFGKPIDQADQQSVALGATFTSPSFLTTDVSAVTAVAGINCELSIIKAADGLVFPDDGFSPIIPVKANQAWLGVELDLTGTVEVGASVNGVGISFEGTETLSCSTYTLFAPEAPPLPLLRDACATAFGNFSMATNPAALRSQLANTVNVTELNGSVTVAVALEVPFTLNPLASVNLPFNKTASIEPNVLVELAPSLQISGDLLVRSYKVSESILRLGVYKKHGTTFSVSFAAAAGIEGEIGTTDVLGTLLNKALPGVDVAKSGITGGNAAELNSVINGSLDRSLSAQMNATCSATHTDEAAVLYEIDLIGGEKGTTDDALGSALHGDWTRLEKLSLQTPTNVRRLRNIAVETVDKQISFTVNLFGFYSAVSISEYLQSCTVLVDESGQISIADKVDASRISASVTPYAADTEKLRRALMEDFLCTATYAVVAGKLNLKLTVVQSYLDYKPAMSPHEMQENVLLGYMLGLIPFGSLDDTLKANSSFNHACATAVVKYDMPALLNVFFKDPSSMQPRSKQEIEVEGRRVMAALIVPPGGDDGDTDKIRLDILRNDAVWAKMDEIGNIATFNTISGLGHLGITQLAAVSGDWVSVAWWSDAISRVAPAIKETIGALSAVSSNDPTQDPAFMKSRDTLADLLGSVARNSDAGFEPGWGEAVTFGLSGGHGVARMDILWSGGARHYGPPAKP